MLRRLLLPFLGLLLLAAEPGATWSIVCVNVKTREVGVASATCLENFNLRKGVPVIVVGEGAAAAQSFLDQSGDNRQLIFARFNQSVESPAEILAELAAQDSEHQTRQYGIVNFDGAPVTFTGLLDGKAATGVSGQVGDFLYAIQGNVLTGDAVVFAAETAFRSKKGDMGQKMLAAMEAARALGGDGRCSCSAGRPTSCGVPPPSFTKSAHAGVFVVARVGDEDGACGRLRGCAQGEYFLNLNVVGDRNDPDPVFTLQERYDEWREEHRGRPDGLYSRLGRAKDLPADGVTERNIIVELRDINEQRILHGGAMVEVATVDGSPSLATLGPVLDQGDGHYTFTVRAGTQVGLDRLAIRVTDVSPTDPADVVTATLYPYLELETLPIQLFASETQVSAREGGRLPLVVNRPDKPLAPYLLVARIAASTSDQPGRLWSRGLPLLSMPHGPFSPGAPLTLDARGRAETVLSIPPGLLAPLVGRRIECTAFVLDGAPLERTNRVGFEIVP